MYESDEFDLLGGEDLLDDIYNLAMVLYIDELNHFCFQIQHFNMRTNLWDRGLFIYISFQILTVCPLPIFEIKLFERISLHASKILQTNEGL